VFEVSRDGRAVSPVIGIVLMVAVTVILAAVIGTSVLGLSGDVEESPTAGLTFEQTAPGGTIEVQVSVAALSNADCVGITQAGSAAGASGGFTDVSGCDTGATSVGGTTLELGSVGAAGTLAGVSPGDEFVIVAADEDGNRAVVRTYTVE
jgi:flagellin-like protein